MNLFKLKPQFDPNTGKPTHPKKIKVGCLCDYCGKNVQEAYERLEDYAYDTTYKTVENENMEQSWYYLEPLKDIGGNIIADSWSIFSENEEYVYCRPNFGEACDIKMIREFMDNKVEISAIYDIMQQARMNMLKKVLIEEKKYTKEDLNL